MVTRDKINWYRTKVPKVWFHYHDLPYKNEPFNDVHCLQYWQQLGYTQSKFTGDMYDMRQPAPDWMSDIHSSFPWQHWSWSIYRMTPGCVLPWHRDTYQKFKILHDIRDCHTIRRALVFLEDWQSGHYFELDGEPITKWSAGDAVAWCYDTPHIAANMGTTDRYTLQITGTQDEN